MGQIKKNYLYNTVFQVLMLIVPIITTPYLTRVIGAEGIGTYAFHNSVANYFVIFIKLGLDNYGNREIAEKKISKSDLNKSFSELFSLQLICGIIVSTVYIVYSLLISNDQNYSWLFFVTVLAAWFDINWFLYGMEQFKAISLRNISIKMISTCLIFLFVKSSNDIWIYCLILVVCNLISQIIAWPILFKEVRFIKVRFQDILKHLKPNLLLFLTVLSVSIFKIMDKIMLGIFTAGKTQVGFYEAAERIINIPNILVVSLGTVMMPRIANMISSNDDSYKGKIYTSLVLSMCISASLAFGIMGVSKEFVPLFYGSGFDTVQVLYLILLPCCLFMAFANVIRTQYLIPNHRDKEFLASSALGALTNLLVNLALIPSYGAIGAAIGTLVAEIVVCAYQTLAVRKELNIRKFFTDGIKPVFIGLLMFLVIFFIPVDSMPNLFVSLMIKVAVGAVSFIALFILTYIIEQRKGNFDYVNSVRSILPRKENIKRKR